MSLEQPSSDASEEISALIEVLHKTGQRLEALTAGEIDAVADIEGRTFFLPNAQEQLRHIEEAKQAAILNALPAHIALVDSHGLILSVNEAWRQFSGSNVVHGPGHRVGLNWLEICDSAQGDASAEAHQIAEGMRSVLGGQAKSFSIEYACHTPTEQLWFLMTAIPLVDERPNGAVVMHSNITERKRAEQTLLDSEEHFRFLNDLAEATRTLAKPEQIMEVMSRMLGVHLRASRCAYADVENDGEQFTILHDYTDGCASTVGSYHLSLFGARAVATLNSGQTLVIRSVEAELLPAEGADMFNAIGIKAIITCPLVKDGRLRAMMAVHQTTPRDWTSGEVAIVQEVVERCWATIERGTAEEKLRQGEALLRIAGRTARLGGWTVDLPEVRVTWSDEVCAIHDVPPGTVHGLEQAFSCYAPQSRETVSKAIEACAQRGTPFDLELEVISAKGRRVWVRSIGEAYRDAAGAITRLQGAVQDITERKQAAEELRESERRFSDMLGNVEMVSLMLDTKARITYCNDYLLRLTGWRRDEVTGRDWFELFIPSENGDLKNVNNALLANNPEAMHHENEILTRAGERRLIRWNNSVLRSGAGDVIGTASIGEDITERKIADEVLQKRAAELERFHRLSVGRELQMVELKKQVNELATQAGQKPPYDLAFLGEQPVKTNPGYERTSSIREDVVR